MHRQQHAHPALSQIGVCQQPGGIGKAEYLCIMRDIAAGLKARRHDEMRLVPIQPCKIRDPCLVIPRRRPENLMAQGHGGGKQGVIRCQIILGQRLQRLTCGGRDCGENSQQGMRMAQTVARDKIGIVEIVAGIKPHPRRQTRAKGLLMCPVQQRDFDAIHLAGVFRNQRQHKIRCARNVVAAPISRQCRVEHIAQPMQHHRVRRAVNQVAVDAGIGRLRRADCGERAAGHQDQLPARRLDRLRLRLIRGDDRIGVAQIRQWHMIGPGTAGDTRAHRMGFGGKQRALDQVQRRCPVKPHAALCCVHSLGK